MNTPEELTEGDRKHILLLFTNHGMCPDCLEELRFALRGAKKDDSSKNWLEFLCYECEGIFYELAETAKKKAER
jgi:hypothetical protein